MCHPSVSEMNKYMNTKTSQVYGSESGVGFNDPTNTRKHQRL